MKAVSRTFIVSMAALVAVVAAGAAVAHHSFAMFDYNKAQTVSGTIKEVQWSNPHVIIWLYGEAAAGTDPPEWWLESTSPSNLTRFGWSRQMLNAGEKVEVKYFPLRDGRNGGAVKQVTLKATGQILNVGSLADLSKP